VLELTAPPAALPRAAGRALFGVLVLFVAAGAALRAQDAPLLATVGGVIAVAFGAAAMLGPRRYLLPAAALATAGITLIGNGTSSNVGWFGMVVLAAWCTLSAPLLVAAGYWAGSVVLIVCEAVFTIYDPGWLAWVGGTTFAVVASLFGRRQRDLVAQLRAAQADLARRAQTEERNRIARELHDVIAHSLTVLLLHVSSARLALDDDRDDAARALEEAERLGRQSLDEVRHVVGSLRRDGGADPTAPLPGSVDVPALVDRFRAAGVDVQANVSGDLAVLPGLVGLATYRILQEALTNAVKHAPHARSFVEVIIGGETVQLSVDTSGPPPPSRGNGLGLVGMRERAESLGGRFTAGPGGSGWLVCAEIPL
jgi:signal transduction histidine kinase